MRIKQIKLQKSLWICSTGLKHACGDNSTRFKLIQMLATVKQSEHIDSLGLLLRSFKVMLHRISTYVIAVTELKTPAIRCRQVEDNLMKSQRYAKILEYIKTVRLYLR